MESHGLFVEKYRPKDLSTYVGNDHLKSKVERFITDGNVPHLLLYGRAGGGKTTLAKIIVNHVECDYLYINASDERNIDLVRDKLKTFASSIGFKPMKIVILDEADYLNVNSAQPALRNLMETFSAHCRFILTCNYVEKIIDPIQSRCQSYKIVPPSKKDVALHAKTILEKENISFDLDDLALVVTAGYPDLRRVINELQRMSIDGKLKIDKDGMLHNEFKLQFLEMIQNNSDIRSIRKLIADSGFSDYTELFRFLYDEVENITSDKIPDVIVEISKGAYQDVMCVDKEINFIATMSSILGKLQ
ncbi:AAA family ATPase [Candidatus Woesearchaeota archaeon]|jgi:DNA polymerase III delta prime subunit|nr:AAA family ATPase [Candidatus Woesearchaeota archaeon]